MTQVVKPDYLSEQIETTDPDTKWILEEVLPHNFFVRSSAANPDKYEEIWQVFRFDTPELIVRENGAQGGRPTEQYYYSGGVRVPLKRQEFVKPEIFMVVFTPHRLKNMRKWLRLGGEEILPWLKKNKLKLRMAGVVDDFNVTTQIPYSDKINVKAMAKAERAGSARKQTVTAVAR